jgi:hypothetical protein
MKPMKPSTKVEDPPINAVTYRESGLTILYILGNLKYKGQGDCYGYARHGITLK